MSNKGSDRKLTSQLPGTSSDWKEMLLAYPIRNTAAGTEQDDETLRISVPTRKPWWYKIPPVSWAVRPPDYRQIVLDRIGRSIWEKCDGETTVEQIVVFFAEKHNLSFHESRVSVTSYLKLLIKRGALAIAL